MLVLGLVSGGKDSCFNLVHCQLNGHQIVALGNLAPASGVEELDSPFYQTVGQTSVKHIADAIGIPLYTQTITGRPICETVDYVHQGQDETEDLAALVETVLKSHPDIKAISSGAVLSNYQRVRVEHICERFGLVSLSYLWQRDQSALLDEMYDYGMHSIIIKVAGAGLRLRHLGVDVTSPQMRSELAVLEKFGLHPAGEGGEYETYTVDCPIFKKQVNISSYEKILTSAVDDGFYTVGFLRIKEIDTVAKSIEDQQISCLPARPSLLDEGSLKLEKSVRRIVTLYTDPMPGYTPYTNLDTVSVMSKDNQISSEKLSAPRTTIKPSVSFSNTTLVIGNVTARITSRTDEDTLTQEITNCLNQILQIIKQQNDHRSQNFELTGISLFISVEYMRRFVDVNKAYKACLHHIVPPPVRAAVAVVLPEGIDCLVEAVAHETSASNRQGLHVQGLSYWAPACIGPYSQAISVFDNTFISGQIAMDPANLNLVRDQEASGLYQLIREAVLSSQHLTKIYEAVNGPPNEENSSHWLKGGICWLNSEDNWWSYTWLLVRQVYEGWIPANQTQNILFVSSDALPKDASVEWQLLCARKIESEQDTLSSVSNVCVQLFDTIESIKKSITNAQEEKWDSIRAFCVPGTDCSLLTRTLEEIYPCSGITVIVSRYVADGHRKSSIGIMYMRI